MTIVEMTKAQVIEALEKEPRLTAGTWAKPEREARKIVACSYCAVGAVVRQALAGVDIDPVIEVAEDCGSDGGVMQSLSDVYENAAWGDTDFEYRERRRVEFADMEAGRAAAIAHVRERFPGVVRIDIGNAEPRAGMRVLGAEETGT